MLAHATARFVRISPSKVRPMVDALKGQEASAAIAVLRTTSKRGARILLKAIQSALANGRKQLTPESIWHVKNIIVNDGPRMKRSRSAPMGRAMMIYHRLAHVTVTLETEAQPEEK